MTYKAKTATLVLAAAVLITGLFTAPAFAVSSGGHVNDADIDALTSTLDAINVYTGALEDSSVPISEVVADGQAAQAKIAAFGAHSFVTSLGSAYSHSAASLKQDVSTISTDIGIIDGDLQRNDITQANTDNTALNTHIDQFNNDVTALNASVDTHNAPIVRQEKTMNVAYLGLLIVTVVICAGSFAWAKRQKMDPLDAHARMSVAKTSIAPVVGAAITFGSFYLAKNGGTYFIAWGPVAVGGIAYVRSLANYRATKKLPAQPVHTGYAPMPGVATPVHPQQFSPNPVTPVNPVPGAPTPAPHPGVDHNVHPPQPPTFG
ncbi:MAG TPA: hypothetical protein VLH84_05720 [Patescibacteria group bacterium]|nr:hypothetical protein [Patescibacteria group bacterium]